MGSSHQEHEETHAPSHWTASSDLTRNCSQSSIKSTQCWTPDRYFRYPTIQMTPWLWHQRTSSLVTPCSPYLKTRMRRHASWVSTHASLKLRRRLNEDLWKSWKRDYLIELQIKKRWFKNSPKMQVNDLVLHAEDNEAPLQWKTGRIIEIFSGNDDITRVCKLKTATTILIRPVVKLWKLSLSSGPSGASTASQWRRNKKQSTQVTQKPDFRPY